MDECQDPPFKCSNPKCGVTITARQAKISEIFMGTGKPLCESCYEISVIKDRSKSHAEMLKKLGTERAKQKASIDNPEVGENAGT